MQYFEDIECDVVHRFGQYEVTREEVIEFAEKYDPQPFHLSDEAAAQTHFGRIAASGWHSCAMTMRMMVDYFSEKRLVALGSPGVDQIHWIKPVYPGDKLACELVITEKRVSRSKPEIGITKHAITVLNQENDKVMTIASKVIVATRPN